MSLLLCVLFPKCHGAESNFTDYKIGIPNLIVLHRASLWLCHGGDSGGEFLFVEELPNGGWHWEEGGGGMERRNAAVIVGEEGLNYRRRR